jgi:hypothetical protein
MGIFDMSQSVVSSASSIIVSDNAVDMASVVVDMEARLQAMEVGPLLGLWFQSLIVGLTMNVLSICIFLVIYGRMIEIYLVTSIGPIPMATLANREWGSIGQNYLRSLLALSFQAFLIIVCVRDLCRANPVNCCPTRTSAARSGARWATRSCCASTLFKTGSLAKSIFNAH